MDLKITALLLSFSFWISYLNGQSWTTPLPIGPASNFSDMTILEVEGHPAVCYENYPPGQIMYVRALDPCGETWGTPVNVGLTNPNSQFGFNPSMAIVNGRPAISYYSPNTQELIYVRANDIYGNSWSNFKIADTNGNVGQMSELRIVNGHPAISYIDLTNNCNNFMKYVRSLDIDGNTWGSPVSIRELGCGCCQRSKFEIINGHPALMYRNNGGGGNLEYVRANDPDGSSWPPPQLLGTSKDPNELTVINGLPVALISLYAIDSLGVMFANDVNGSSWGTVDTLNLETNIQVKANLRILDDSVRVTFSNWSSAASLWYTQSPLAQPMTFSTPEAITNPVWYGIDSDMETACGNMLTVYTDLGTLYSSIKNTGACVPPVINFPGITHPTCSVSTGSITVNASSTRTLEYSIDNGTNYQVSNTFTGLAPGNYSIVVRHKFDPTCSTVYSANPVVVDSPPALPLVNAPAVSQPDCMAPIGSITVNASGSGNLEHSVNNGTNWQNSATFTGLAPGNYNLKVRLQSDPGCVTTYSGNPVVLNLPGQVFTSTDVPKTIPSSGTPTVTSTLAIPISGTITDVNVLNLDIDHTYISDLVVKLKSPANTERTLLNQICGSQNNILLNLDDESANTYNSIPCPPNGGTYRPYQALSVFDGENLNGTWTLIVQDLFNSDGGILQAWSIGVCYTPGCSAPVVNAPTVTQPTCATPTGSIVANATGNGALEYSVNNGVNWQTSSTFNDLAPGSYNLVVRLLSEPACTTAYTGNPVILDAPTGCCPPVLVVNASPIMDGTYLAEMEITSNGLVPVNGSVMFGAGVSIELQPGFEVMPGGVFEIILQGCVP